MKDPFVPQILTPEANEAALEAIHAAKNAAQAIETARALQVAAMNENTTKSLVDALRAVFGENEDSKRFIDISKIPLICKSIVDIHDTLTEIKDMFAKADERYVNQDQFFTVKAIAFGFAGAVLTGFMGMLVYLVFHIKV